MKKTKQVRLPLTQVQIDSLRAGDLVELTGPLYSARDAAHSKMTNSIKKRERLAFPLRYSTIYYMGPSPARPGKIIGAAGPTTSARMDGATPVLIAKGLRGMIGKGERSPAVADSIKRYGAVYFVAAGGTGAVLGKTVKSARIVAYPELGPEAVRLLEVEKFPCWVGIDRYGKSIFPVRNS
jgi:fumarate hydratase subunit beta